VNGNRLLVDARVPWRRIIFVHRERIGFGPPGFNAVSLARGNTAEQGSTQRVDDLRLQGAPLWVDQRHVRSGRESGGVHLLDAADGIDARRFSGGGSPGSRERAGEKRPAQEDGTEPKPACHGSLPYPRSSRHVPPSLDLV